MKSIKYKIMVPVLVAAALGILALVGIVYKEASSIISTDIESITQSKVEKVITVVDGKLNEWKQTIVTLSSVEVVKNRDFEGVKKLASSSEFSKDFENIIISGKDGIYVSTNGEGGNISDREYFPQVMGGQSVISKPVISKSTGKPIIVVATPIRDQGGVVVGLIGGTINLETITKFVNSEKLGTTGYAYMLDKEGIVMAHPKSEYILKENFLNNKSKSLVEITKKMISGNSAVENYEFEGVEKIAAYGTVKSTGWSIAMATTYGEVSKSITSLRNIVAIVGIITIAVIGIIIYIIVIRTIKPLIEIADITKEVAAGDLTVNVNIKSKDEIGLLANNFNSMIENIRGLLSEVSEMGTTVASASQQMMVSTEDTSKIAEQVASTISEIAQGATAQAEAAHNGSDMVNELVAEIDKISNHAVNSEKLTVKAMETVKSGIRIGEYQNSKTLENKEAAMNVGEAIELLANKSHEIGQIVEFITDIAEQTNLLALNAAIEAARAGEQGRGFAVVAEEVRKLAEESNRATQDISKIINEIKTSVDTAVKDMSAAKAIVGEQEEAAKETVGIFEEILNAVSEVTENIKEVSEASKIINENSKVVGSNIDNIASIAQENAAGVEEVAASTEEQAASIEEIAASAGHLQEISVRLHEAMGKFKV